MGMSYLLDTHILLWWLFDDRKLNTDCRDIIRNPCLRAGSLPISHRDPFDRMIMAQAELEGLPILTYDKAFQTGLIQVIPSVN